MFKYTHTHVWDIKLIMRTFKACTSTWKIPRIYPHTIFIHFNYPKIDLPVSLGLNYISHLKWIPPPFGGAQKQNHTKIISHVCRMLWWWWERSMLRRTVLIYSFMNPLRLAGYVIKKTSGSEMFFTTNESEISKTKMNKTHRSEMKRNSLDKWKCYAVFSLVLLRGL